MAGRGSKSALDALLDDLRLEALQDETDLLADDRLPEPVPIEPGFLAFITAVVSEVEPNFVLDDATALMAQEIERAVRVASG